MLRSARMSDAERWQGSQRGRRLCLPYLADAEFGKHARQQNRIASWSSTISVEIGCLHRCEANLFAPKQNGRSFRSRVNYRLGPIIIADGQTP